jgi:nicotinamidase-related amidase
MVQTQLKQALLVIDIQNNFTGNRASNPIERIQASEQNIQ